MQVVEEQFDDDGRAFVQKLASYALTSRSYLQQQEGGSGEHWSVAALRDGWLICCPGPIKKRRIKTHYGICSPSELEHAARFRQVRCCPGVPGVWAPPPV